MIELLCYQLCHQISQLPDRLAFPLAFPDGILPRMPARRFATGLLASPPWPDTIDISAIILFMAATLGIPLLGYLLLYVDLRTYYRALKGVLVRVTVHFPTVPAWARHETPGCMRALGLRLPCTESELKKAYRALAEKHHPDRGGDPQQFHRLHEQFEAALEFLRTRDL